MLSFLDPRCLWIEKRINERGHIRHLVKVEKEQLLKRECSRLCHAGGNEAESELESARTKNHYVNLLGTHGAFRVLGVDDEKQPPRSICRGRK